MSVVDLLRSCEARLEKDAGLLVDRGFNASLLSEINMSLFIKTGTLQSFHERPPARVAFEEERLSLRLLKELKMAGPAELEQWKDAERDAHSRHYAMVRFLVGRALWRMREEVCRVTTPPMDEPNFMFALAGRRGQEEDNVIQVVSIHIPCVLWMFFNPVTPSGEDWARTRLCKDEMEAIACACIAFMILSDIRVKAYRPSPSTSATGVLDAIDIDFVWLWKK